VPGVWRYKEYVSWPHYNLQGSGLGKVGKPSYIWSSIVDPGLVPQWVYSWVRIHQLMLGRWPQGEPFPSNQLNEKIEILVEVSMRDHPG